MDAVPEEAQRALRNRKVKDLFDPTTGERIGRLCKLSFYNKTKALKTLGRYLGMFNPVSKVTTNDSSPLTLAKWLGLSTEALASGSEGSTNGTPAPSKPLSEGGAKRRGSHRRNRFAVEYLNDFNATQAAIRAGYSAKTAASQGQRLLKFPEVRDAIAHTQAELIKKNEVSVENVKRELERIAFSSIGPFFDKHSHASLPISAVPEEARRALSRLRVIESFDFDRGDKQRIGRPYELVFSYRTAALKLLAEHLGMYARPQKSLPGIQIRP